VDPDPTLTALYSAKLKNLHNLDAVPAPPAMKIMGSLQVWLRACEIV
jgi:hypothetical protein